LGTLNLLVRLGRGDIVPKPGIKRLVGGSAVEADAIIYCTGYKISFPFFDPGILVAPQGCSVL
jgi:dimethylaniline monooxygenase (N-oxide forming)